VSTATGDPHRGQRPSADDLRWIEAAAELTPAKTLGRIDAKVGFVFANITLIATVLAGFGILTGAADRASAYQPFTLAALGFLMLAVLFASVANLPTLRTKINADNLVEVREFYERIIAFRGWLTRLALIFFVVGLASALGVLATVAGKNDPPAMGLQWTLGTDGKRGLAGYVTGTRLPAGARVETVLAAVGPQGDSNTVLAKDMSAADDAGKVAVRMEVADIPASASFRLSTKVQHAGKVLFPEQAVEITS